VSLLERQIQRIWVFCREVWVCRGFQVRLRQRHSRDRLGFWFREQRHGFRFRCRRAGIRFILLIRRWLVVLLHLDLLRKGRCVLVRACSARLEGHGF
jgi:hypothetical protein